MQISFWMDKWVFPYPLKDILYVCCVEMLWDRTTLSAIIPSHLVDKICSLYIPSRGCEDELVLGLSSD